MANEKEPEPGTRGWRINQLRERLKEDRGGLAKRLAKIAAAFGLDGGGKWTLQRVSTTINERKPLPLADAAAIVLLARVEGVDDFTWDFLVFGQEHPEWNVTDETIAALASERQTRPGALESYQDESLEAERDTMSDERRPSRRRHTPRRQPESE